MLVLCSTLQLMLAKLNGHPGTVPGPCSRTTLWMPWRIMLGSLLFINNMLKVPSNLVVPLTTEGIGGRSRPINQSSTRVWHKSTIDNRFYTTTDMLQVGPWGGIVFVSVAKLNIAPARSKIKFLEASVEECESNSVCLLASMSFIFPSFGLERCGCWYMYLLYR